MVSVIDSFPVYRKKFDRQIETYQVFLLISTVQALYVMEFGGLKSAHEALQMIIDDDSIMHDSLSSIELDSDSESMLGIILILLVV